MPSLPASLAAILGALPKMALAFSGGLDSRFLAHAAQLCGSEILLLHATGPHIPAAESAYARSWAAMRQIPLRELSYNPLVCDELARNRRNRCYVCKKNLYGLLQAMLPGPDWRLCDGAQADDMQAYRPGNRAAAELGVVSPLAQAGLHKSDIREIARATGMEAPDQQARPCLLTRIAYDQPVSPRLLGRIEACEKDMAAILGGADFRLRLTPAPVLQLASVPPEGLARILATHGFADAQILQSPDISGFFDRPQNRAGSI